MLFGRRILPRLTIAIAARVQASSHAGIRVVGAAIVDTLHTSVNGTIATPRRLTRAETVVRIDGIAIIAPRILAHRLLVGLNDTVK